MSSERLHSGTAHGVQVMTGSAKMLLAACLPVTSMRVQAQLMAGSMTASKFCMTMPSIMAIKYALPEKKQQRT